MTCGGWTGARPGLFALNTLGRWGGWADVKYVKISNAQDIG
jgi:acyl-CoA-binding protein